MRTRSSFYNFFIFVLYSSFIHFFIHSFIHKPWAGLITKLMIKWVKHLKRRLVKSRTGIHTQVVWFQILSLLATRSAVSWNKQNEFLELSDSWPHTKDSIKTNNLHRRHNHGYLLVCFLAFWITACNLKLDWRESGTLVTKDRMSPGAGKVYANILSMEGWESE